MYSGASRLYKGILEVLPKVMQVTCLLTFAAVCFIVVALLAISVLAVVVAVKARRAKRRRLSTDEKPRVVLGFFHPYCDAGGGGERVLWTAVAESVRSAASNVAVRCVVYTGDVSADPRRIADNALRRFGIDVRALLDDGSLEMLYLHRRPAVEAAAWPHFTLLGQSLGSMYLGLEALSLCCPDVYIDTMGYAFTLPLFRYLGGCSTASYVHYPTISTDMLARVRSRVAAHNNSARIARSGVATFAKVTYYRFFAWLYGLCGRCSDVVMVNSSWTEEHISALWGNAASGALIQKVFPPCDLSEFKDIGQKKLELQESDSSEKQWRVLSLGQFRPEKDHVLQLKALAKVRDAIYEDRRGSEAAKDRLWESIRLVLVGGCRHKDDERRVRDLRDLAAHLAVDTNVEFLVNVDLDELRREMGSADIGLHTMWNEHFGIAVVEMMAAGLLTLAHRSGGPLMDIVTETPESSRTGYLAVTDDEYAEAIVRIVTDTTAEARKAVRRRAIAAANRFSTAEFERGWSRAMSNLARKAKDDVLALSKK